MKNHRWPVIVLFFLAPITGELLSSSAPPAEFFNPFGLVILPALYGSGALLIRELVRRWGKGWASVILLGMAYGIYEEGIVVRSFFDPAWPDLGIMAEYGRWLGVNWVWALDLTIYHAVVSITIPIMLVELLFPAHRHEPWLRRRGLVIHSLLFLSVIAVGPFFGLHASVLAILGCVVSIALLTFLAYRWPVSADSDTRSSQVASPGCFTILGFSGMLAFVLTMWALPEMNVPVFLVVPLTIIFPLLLAALVWVLGLRKEHDRHLWAFSAGGLLIWIIVAFIAELDNVNRPDDTTGMALVGLAFLIFLIIIGVRIWRRKPEAPPQLTEQEPSLISG